MIKDDNIEVKLFKMLSPVVYFAKKHDFFIEFYIYISSYEKLSQTNDDIDSIKIEETGIGMTLFVNGEEFYYYEEGLNINSFFKMLKNEFEFDIDFTAKDNCKPSFYGHRVNPLKTASYKKRLLIFLIRKKMTNFYFLYHLIMKKYLYITPKIVFVTVDFFRNY